MKILKNTSIYLFASVISKGAPFLLLPFLTSYLQPTEFGILAIFLVMNGLYGAFIGMAMHANISKNFFRHSKPKLAIITGNVFFVLILNTSIFFLITSLMLLFLDSFFSIPSKYLLILPISAFFAMANQIHLTVLRNEGRAYTFGAFEITNAFLSVSITIVLLTYLNFGWLSQVVSMLSSTIFLSVIGVVNLYKKGYLSFSFNKPEALSILRLSLPLIPHKLSGVIISVTDRLFIERIVGLEAVALYSIGYSFGKLVSLIVDAIIKAWNPWFYEQLAEPTFQKKTKIVKLTYVYLVVVFVIAFFISLFGEFVMPFMVNDSYTDGAKYILWIALGYAARGVYRIFFPYLVHISKTNFLAFSTFIAATTNVTMNFLLIPEYGALGAAYATILAYTVNAFMVFEYQRRNFWMPWLFKNQKK